MLDSSSGAASGRPALGWENVEGAILPQPSRRVRGTLGGVTDLAPLARAAASLLTRLRQTVGVSESSAGGLISAADRKSTRLNSSHVKISYAVFCLKKKKNTQTKQRDKKKNSKPQH